MENEACCPAGTYQTGCLVCGQPLTYVTDLALRAACVYCGREELTHAFCMNGHYVCDGCHGKDIPALMEAVCAQSDSRDPVALALALYELPGLPMHGPEYHSLVPAVLVTAYGNSTGQKDPAALREAFLRGRKIFGGICGTHGACGAAIGVGIAYSVIYGVTPYAVDARGEANKMTALALTAIGGYGGPRCCKRDAMLAIETAKKHFGCYPAEGEETYVCSQFPDNTMCIADRCPYYPNSVLTNKKPVL